MKMDDFQKKNKQKKSHHIMDCKIMIYTDAEYLSMFAFFLCIENAINSV